MPDDRPLIEKLEAMASQEQSPREAEIAREIIRRMLGESPINDDGKVLSRDDILGTADRASIGGVQRVRMSNGQWATIDVDEMSIVFDVPLD